MSLTISSGITINSGFIGVPSPDLISSPAGNTFTFAQIVTSGSYNYDPATLVNFHGVFEKFSTKGIILVDGCVSSTGSFTGIGWFGLYLTQENADFFNAARVGYGYYMVLPVTWSPGTVCYQMVYDGGATTVTDTSPNLAYIGIALPAGDLVAGEEVICTLVSNSPEYGYLFVGGEFVFPIVIGGTPIGGG